MTTLTAILRGAGCKVETDCAGRRGAWVLMTQAARAILVAAGERDALDVVDGTWLRVEG